jgi:hypothetical protein
LNTRHDSRNDRIRNTDQERKNYPPKGKLTFAIVNSRVTK